MFAIFCCVASPYDTLTEFPTRARSSLIIATRFAGVNGRFAFVVAVVVVVVVVVADFFVVVGLGVDFVVVIVRVVGFGVDFGVVALVDVVVVVVRDSLAEVVNSFSSASLVVVASSSSVLVVDVSGIVVTSSVGVGAIVVDLSVSFGIVVVGDVSNVLSIVSSGISALPLQRHPESVATSSSPNINTAV